MIINIKSQNQLDDLLTKYNKTNIMVKYDNIHSKYNHFIHTLNINVINITTAEELFFENDNIKKVPTIYYYKNNNLVQIIEGFKTKTELNKIINYFE